jgi:hypothetical protein
MQIYDIRFCKKVELPLLVDFIKNHWQSDHVFVKSTEMLDFQHLDIKYNRYNFIIGYNMLTKQIDGILGIIPLSHFDQELYKYKDTWGGIWKVRSDVKNEEISNLGANLFSFFNEYKSHGSVGMSKIATVLHKIRKYKTGVLSQYYILNNNILDFKIAKVTDFVAVNKLESNRNNTRIKLISDILQYKDSEFTESYFPRKSIKYLYNRFHKHPVYKYDFWEISNKESKVIIVSRKIFVNNSSVIRIVDVFGRLENFDSLFEQFQEILQIENAEYIDILNFGISNDIFYKIGFKKLYIKDNIIIPTYFEPFIQENIEINCAYSSESDYVIFKADADQDRPSILLNYE